MGAPSYATRRSQIAQAIALGRPAAMAENAPMGHKAARSRNMVQPAEASEAVASLLDQAADHGIASPDAE